MLCAICVFCGLPGAGKSTVAKYICEGEREGFSYIHVCYDSLMPSVNLTPNLDGSISAWKAARMNIRSNLESMIRHLLLGEGPYSSVHNKNVIKAEIDSILNKVQACKHDDRVVFLIDDNMHYRGMRHEYYRLCSRLEIAFSVAHFDCPLETCYSRNAGRPDPILNAVIEKMHKQFESPGQSEQCKWEKYFATLHAKDMLPPVAAQKILNMVEDSMSDPVRPPAVADWEEVGKARAANRRNFVHQADICLRKNISSKLGQLQGRGGSKKEIAELANALNHARKQQFELLKLGYVDTGIFLDKDGSIDLLLLEQKMAELLDCGVT